MNRSWKARAHWGAGANRKLGDFIELVLVVLMFILGLLLVDRVNGQETPVPMTDEGILVNVESALISSEAVNAYQVHVDVREGVVTLSGMVDNLRARQQAVTVVGATPGVKRVMDRLRVRPSRLDDQRLRQKVTSAVMDKAGIDPKSIQVNAQSGKVVLTGGVDSHADKMMIGEAIQGLPGVVQLENQIDAPTQIGLGDSGIANAIQEQLESRAWSEAGEIVVEVKDGYVTLRGTVGTPEDKLEAVRIAWIEGVRGVDADQLDSRIEAPRELVAPLQAPPAPPDRQTELKHFLISDKIATALRRDPRVDLGDIHVCYADGVARLSGRVYTLASRRAAEMKTFRHPAVVKVINELNVAPPSPICDERIEHDLKRLVRLHPFIRETSVDVDVYGGVAVLNGRVSSPEERLRADALAANQPGVVSLRNNLRIGRWTNRTDEELRRSVEEWLFWSKIVNWQNIQVQASNGAVTLTGVVPTPEAAQVAVTRAYQAGAQTVVNQIQVVKAEPIMPEPICPLP